MAKKPRYSSWESAGIGSGHVPPGGYRDSIIDAPSTTANFEYLLGALRSKAPGQWSANVLELANHFTNVAFLAINTLANQAASCEKKVFERTYEANESDEELSWSEPLCRFLDNPNDDDDFSDLMYQISQQISLTGLGLLWLPNPNEMYVLPTASCLPWPPSPIYPHGSYLVQPYYPYGPFSTVPSYQSAAGARIPAEQVIRIKNPHPILRYDGYAVLTALRRQIDTIDSIDAARWSTQQRGVDPSMVATFDPKVYNIENQPDLNRLRVQLDAMYSGATNAGRILPAPIGTTLTKLSQAPAEMAWQEGWEQLMKFVMSGYGVPSVIAGLTDSTSYATLYASMQQFDLISLNPHLKRISSKFNSGLIRPHYGENLYLQLQGRKITDEDMQIKKFTLGLSAKAVKVNELRKLMDLPPDETPKGDEYCGAVKESDSVSLDADKPAGNDFEQESDPNVESARPDNAQGVRAVPPSKTYSPNRLAEVLDGAKHNGHLKGLSKDERDFFMKFTEV